MAAPGALAILVALSMTSAVVPSAVLETGNAQPSRDETMLHMPQLVLHAPATVPAAASPRLSSDRQALLDAEPDVDVTGPAN
jgi:hypothetical protein